MTPWERFRDFITRQGGNNGLAYWKEQARIEKTDKELWKKSSGLWQHRYEDAVSGTFDPSPHIIGEIGVNEVVGMIKAIWPNVNLAPYKPMYKLCTIAGIQRGVRQARIARLDSIAGSLECADYTFGIIGEMSYYDGWRDLPVGLIDGTYKGGHVWLVAVAYATSIAQGPQVYCLDSVPPHLGKIIPLEDLKGEIISRIVIP